jgi:hypothetical protein
MAGSLWVNPFDLKRSINLIMAAFPHDYYIIFCHVRAH